MSDERRTVSPTPPVTPAAPQPVPPGPPADEAGGAPLVAPPAAVDDAGTALPSLQRQLESLRAQLEASERERRYVSSSPLLWLALAIEFVVAGLALMALFDWFLSPAMGNLLVRLMLAILLQLAALTAVAASRRES